MTHDELISRGEGWLRRQHCKVILRDGFRANPTTGEQPDVIGWRDHASILIECKATRTDFLSDKRKTFRRDPSLGMGDWRFYLCPPKVIDVGDLPEGWGLLWAYPNLIRTVLGVPRYNNWTSDRPFVANRACENQMLVTALRRVVIRGHFDDVYDVIPEPLQHLSPTDPTP